MSAMIRRAKILVPVLLLAIAAPLAGQALQGHNSNAPIDFEADRIEVQDRADRAVLSGNVKVRQSGLSMDTARLTVAYTGGLTNGNPDVSRLDAAGGVVVRSASETARGQYAIYDINRRQITMLGGVSLQQRGNTINGGRLVIDLDTGRATVDGRSSAPAGSTIEGGTGGRVTGRFTVPERTGTPPQN
jgi:lipopolysaccharide export system protein LptA